MSRELVWTGFMTLDGIVDSPGGPEEGHPNGGWVLSTEFAPEAFALKGEELGETTALMFGRHSYEAFAPIWSVSEDHAGYTSLPKYVIDDWGTIEILRTIDEIAALKERDGGAIFIHGSADLARNLAAANLIDRYNLLIFPVLLGTGKRLFSTQANGRQQLHLREADNYSNGVVKAIYDIHRDLKH
jgi:dihydrofolate reductase